MGWLKHTTFFPLLLTLVIIVPLGTACSALNTTGSGSNKDKKQSEAAPVLADIDQALEIVRYIEADMDIGNLLEAATADQRSQLADLVYGIKASLYLLRKTPNSEPAAKELQGHYDTMAALDFLGADQARFQLLMDSVAKVLNQLSVTIEEVGVPVALYEETFKTELGQFRSFTANGAVAWEIDTKRNFVKASGFKVGKSETWLISPQMDLSTTKEAKLVIRQAVNFLTAWEDLTILWSTDYTGGDPAAATWTTVELSETPEGNSWSFVNSEPVSLESFGGETLVVAFRYRSVSDSKAATWQIGRFAIEGVGTLATTPVDLQGLGKPEGKPEPTPQPEEDEEEDDETSEDGAASLLAADFTEGLGVFTNFSGASSVAWKKSSRDGKNYARVSGFRQDPATVWLLSPSLDLSGVTDPYFVISQSVGHLEDWTQHKVLVSTDYDGTDPTAATWQELTVAEKPDYETFWQWQTSENISLVDYAGQKVTVAFQYTSTAASQPTWQIESFELFGTKE